MGSRDIFFFILIFFIYFFFKFSSHGVVMSCPSSANRGCACSSVGGSDTASQCES